MRQVRNGGEYPVVRPRDRARAPRAPQADQRPATVATAAGIRFRDRRQHDVAIAKERREGGRRARMLGAGDRMAGHEPRERRAEMAPRRRDHVLLGAAGIGEDRARRKRPASAAKSDGKLRHRRREQHDIGIGELARPVGVDRDRAVDDAARSSASSRFARPRPTPTTVPDAARGLQRQRERAADEADADDDELLDAGCRLRSRPSRSERVSAQAPRASASRKRRFSAGSPTVTRRNSGSP